MAKDIAKILKHRSRVILGKINTFRAEDKPTPESSFAQKHMAKIIISLIRGITNGLNSLLSWLEQKGSTVATQAKFVDLAPTDKADADGVYSEAIVFAINNAMVSNIALTGPYGSGKSSIIRSFLKNYQRPALHISLAAFVSDSNSGGEKVSRQEIERSILQQMLYGADANKLPLSRFKRIQSPSVWSFIKSLYITLGVLAVWYTYSQRNAITNGTFFEQFTFSSGFKLTIFTFAIIFLWVALHHLYVASFGLSLKSISLKDVEIRPANDDQTSILNRHMDEILYFFQSTDYDLVIIEDLDRFNDSEIFVTLREINSLVNENSSTKRKVKFLYALRDDMFVNTDRTKFFEFIIPVIPIINTSNSIDMVLKQGSRLALDNRLNKQFLREVSRYLNDLRLIQNIFNEYVIYVANLETDGVNLLDANKLLAILIYKNVYPRDFEKLHRGAGNLFDILNHKNKIISNGESKFRTEIEELEKLLNIAERQTPSDLEELRKIYAINLIEKLPEGVSQVGLNNQNLIPISKLVNNDAFEQIIDAQRIFCRSFNGQQFWSDLPKSQTEVNAQTTYRQRKEEIERKDHDNKGKILLRINELRSKIPTLRTTKLHELLRLDSAHVENLFNEFKENGELARFLILEGHLDDTYYQYTSLFHSGRLSPNDNRFLIQIRAFVTPDPSFPLDNPNEVIAAMREEDFGQSYVLNVRLVDNLLNDQSRYCDQTQKFFELLLSEFENSEEFLSAYYASGLEVSALLSRLVSTGKNIVQTVIASPNNIDHVTQLIRNLPISSLRTLAKDFGELSEFVAVNLQEILMHLPELAPERIDCLDFDVKDLSAIKEHAKIVKFMFEKGRYVLSVSNLEFIYQEILGRTDLQSMRLKNFSTIRSTNNAYLLKKVECDFNAYFHDILLELQENSEEDVSSILEILVHESLDKDSVKKFLKKQVLRLPTLEGVPQNLHATLFQLNAIKATWKNCIDFLETDGFEENSLIGFLDLDVVRAAIMQHPMPNDSDATKLHHFLFNAILMSDLAYKEYAHSLPKTFNYLPEEIDPIKLRVIISGRNIAFSKDMFDALSSDRELQVLFIAVNIREYLNDPNIFALNDDFLEEILRSKIDNTDRLEVIKLLNLDSLVDHPERAALIGQIINDTDFVLSGLSSSGAQSLVTNSRPVETQISLFNQYNSTMSDDEVRLVLANLPPPFSEIKTGYATPRLKNSLENRNLVQWLDTRNIISSWNASSFFTDDIKVNLYRS